MQAKQQVSTGHNKGDNNSTLDFQHGSARQQMLDSMTGFKSEANAYAAAFHNPFEAFKFSPSSQPTTPSDSMLSKTATAATMNLQAPSSPLNSSTPSTAGGLSAGSGSNSTNENSCHLEWDITTFNQSEGNHMRNTWMENAMASLKEANDNNHQNDAFFDNEITDSNWLMTSNPLTYGGGNSINNNINTDSQTNANAHSMQQPLFWSASSGPGTDHDQNEFPQETIECPQVSQQTHPYSETKKLHRSVSDNVTTGQSADIAQSTPSSKEPIWQRRLNSRRQEFSHTISDSHVPQASKSQQTGAANDITSSDVHRGAAPQTSFDSPVVNHMTDGSAAFMGYDNRSLNQETSLTSNGFVRGNQSSFYGSDEPILDALMATSSYSDMPNASSTGDSSGGPSQHLYDQCVAAVHGFPQHSSQKPERSESMGSEASTSSTGSITGDLAASFFGPAHVNTNLPRERVPQRSPTSPRKVTSSLQDDMVHSGINSSKGHRRQKLSTASDATVKGNSHSSLNRTQDSPESSYASLGGGNKGVINKLVVQKGSKCSGDSDGDEDREVRHVCPVDGCDKHFSTSGHARRHSRIHAALRPFECPHGGCGATFTRRDNCTQHQRARHDSQLVAHRIPAERFDAESRP